MSITLQNDIPIQQDDGQLDGRTELVKELVCVASHCQAPMVLGIHGEWGSGKTSVLNLIQEKLKAEHGERIVCIRFEAWRYQNEPVPIVALLQEMRRQFSLPETRFDKAKKVVAFAHKAALSRLGDVAHSLSSGAIPNTDKFKEALESYNKARFENPLASDNLHDSLEEVIGHLLPPEENARVVVLIDDLDRCHPEMAYRLLEGLKIYLDLPNCVFILAMNQRIIIEAFADALKKPTDTHLDIQRAEAYLEKICANIWRLPLLKNPERFLEHCLHGTEGMILVAAIRALPSTDAATRFLPPNPRRLKALANLFKRMWSKAKDRPWSTAEDQSTPKTPIPPLTSEQSLALRLLLVCYLYQSHSELYQRWRYDSRLFEELKSWVALGDPNNLLPDPVKNYLGTLELPARLQPTSASASSPIPSPSGFTHQSRYPDPSADNIFWMSGLLQTALAKDHVDCYTDLLNLE